MATTYPKYRLDPEVHNIHVYARLDALLLIQFRLSQSIRFLIESDMLTGSGVDAVEMAELLTALARPLSEANEDKEPLAEQIPLSPASIDAVELAAHYLQIIGTNLQKNLYAVPQGIADKNIQGEHAQRFLDVSAAAADLAQKLRAVPRD